MSNLKKIDFNADKIAVKTIFSNESVLNSYSVYPIKSDRIEKIYGSQVAFPEIPEDRPYLFGMYVMSMDGKIAFGNSVHGPHIASTNMKDLDGGDTDFWMLSLTRALSDATIKGANMLRREPLHTAHVFDEALVEARLAAGKTACPIHVVITLDGKDVDYDHRIFKEDEVPVFIITSPNGRKYIEETDGNNKDYCYFDFSDSNSVTKDKINKDLIDYSKVTVISTGKDGSLDNPAMMKALRCAGIETCTLESPVYTHVLIGEKLVDEMWLNYSMVYAGGEGRSIGENMPGFTHLDHPHAEILTFQMHSPSFFYIRYKMEYNLAAPDVALK